MCEEKYSLTQITFAALLSLAIGVACTFLSLADKVGETMDANAKLRSDNGKLMVMIQAYEEPVNKLRDMGMPEIMITKYIEDGCVPYFEIVVGRR